MKTVFLVLFAFTITTNSFSQNYMDKIAEDACECLSSISDTLSGDMLNMELGVCMIEAAEPYKKQLKRDYKIDFNKIDKHAEELGSIIGVKVATVCPEALLMMVNKVNDDDEEVMINEQDQFVGKITKIDDSQFVVMSIKNEEGRTTKFYWLNFIISNLELSADYKSLLDKSVKVTFVQQEFFDPRIGEYRMFNVINGIDEIN